MDPEAALTGFISKYSDEVAGLAWAALGKMRGKFPGAVQIVYDNYNALAVGFGATERASDALFSIAVYPRWVTLFFLNGASLADEQGLLKGSGKHVRHIVLREAADLDRPEICRLMDQALSTAGTRLDGPGGRLIIKSVSAKQRPRRPTPIVVPGLP